MNIHQYNRLRTKVAGLLLLCGLLPATYSLAATVNKTSDDSARIIIPVSLINIQATCNLTFIGLDGGGGNYSYSLGPLNQGEHREHKSFKAVIDCQGVTGSETVSTALTATVRKGVVADNRIRMLVDGQNNTNAPELWLENSGQRVPLDGSTAFCKGNRLNRNECTLTPITQVPGTSPNGEVSATVVFDVTYL